MTAQSHFKKAIGAFLKYAKRAGISYVITSKSRTKKKQAELYANPQGYPVATPGRSQHEYGLAWDIDFGGYQNSAGQAWAQWGFGWNPSDPVHFAYFTDTEWAAQLGQVEVAPDYFHGGGPSGFVGGVLSGGYQGMPGATLIVPGSTSGAFSRPAPPFSPVGVSPVPSIAARGIAVVDLSPTSSPPVVTTSGRTLTPGISNVVSVTTLSPGRTGGPGAALSPVSTLPGIPSIASRGIAAP